MNEDRRLDVLTYKRVRFCVDSKELTGTVYGYEAVPDSEPVRQFWVLEDDTPGCEKHHLVHQDDMVPLGKDEA